MSANPSTKSKAATRVVRRAAPVAKKTPAASAADKAARAVAVAKDDGLLCSIRRPVNRLLLDKEPERDRLQCPGCGENLLWRTPGKDGKIWFGCAGACSKLARELENGRGPDERGRSGTSTYASYHLETQILETWVPTALRAASNPGSSPAKRAAAARDADNETSSASDDEDAKDESASSEDERGSEGDPGHSSTDDEELPTFVRPSREVHVELETQNGDECHFTVDTLSETFWYYLLDRDVRLYMAHFRGVYALEVFHAWERRGWMPYVEGRSDNVRIVGSNIRFRICHASHELELPTGSAPILPALSPVGRPEKVFDLTISDSDGDVEERISTPSSPAPTRSTVKKATAARAKADAPKPLTLAPRKTAAAAAAKDGRALAVSSPSAKASTSAAATKGSSSKRAAADTAVRSGAKASGTGTPKRDGGSASPAKGKRAAASVPEGSKAPPKKKARAE
ncbi:hypothetical protein AURDEDRAFT_176416 [Auricularia subglabra TFB-10046 SS5]|uniref:Uncharacterized protein n=1 Tax=Auricularia subglabra (strain TFB-10046 / SS5) TaxID=717982 RepID=J0WQ24_AURST|nr:hypothetical protein AURDEDRAFT_176416 [Auricularia subglabra TFB-10046 SS5]